MSKDGRKGAVRRERDPRRPVSTSVAPDLTLGGYTTIGEQSIRILCIAVQNTAEGQHGLDQDCSRKREQIQQVLWVCISALNLASGGLITSGLSWVRFGWLKTRWKYEWVILENSMYLFRKFSQASMFFLIKKKLPFATLPHSPNIYDEYGSWLSQILHYTASICQKSPPGPLMVIFSSLHQFQGIGFLSFVLPYFLNLIKPHFI